MPLVPKYEKDTLIECSEHGCAKLRAHVQGIDTSTERVQILEKNVQDLTEELEKAKAEIERRHGIGGELVAARRERDALQARIDALMLEYCPGEMTQAQKENWAAHQTTLEAHPKDDRCKHEVSAADNCYQCGALEELKAEATGIEKIAGAISKHISTDLYPREVLAAAQYIYHRYCTYPNRRKASAFRPGI